MVFESTCFIICTILVLEVYSEIEFNDIANILNLNLFNAMPNTNLVASTVMVRLSLIKLAVFASGKTKRELMIGLGYKNETWMRGAFRRMKPVFDQLQLLDQLFIKRIYVDSSYDLDPSFFYNSELQYGVTVEKVSFKYPAAVASFINKWMSESTYRRITEVVDVNDIDKNTSMVIVNGIYFKATWEFPFNYERTKLMPFHHKNGKVSQVEMMFKVDLFEYVDTGEYVAINLKLTWSNTNFICILPHNKDALPLLLDKIYANSTYLTPFLNRMKSDQPITLRIPKMKIKTYVDWTGFLQEIGMYSVFDCNSTDFAGILGQKEGDKKTICLNKIKQKAFLDVDEMGVEKRIFSKTMDGMFSEVWADKLIIKGREVTFNRPFLFMVNMRFSDVHNHELLTGVYYGPE